ncbi:Phosphate transport system permease protein PstC (TC 3.A.1.7.1) [hydrothermal vent metagenome]|uniref:Phosphate transport system permease protein PstC (TC 3.A.1.7.1) n=1 Tax=hydrothermal vent metagenome TaxID=652676 RepID=A0A3B1A630_9ZZZZ
MTIVLVLGFLLQSSWPLIQQQGIAFIVGDEWYPFESLYGMLPALVGTVWAVVLALLIALPCGVAAAIFCAELLPAQLRGPVRFSMELMAGVPSVVYGLLGMWVLLPLLESQLDLLTGRTLLAAGLLLALMILPTIMVLSEDAIRAVRQSQREAAKNLGIGWDATLWRVLLPQAWPGIRVATLLATGRAMGETVAVMLVVGSIDRIPDPFYNFLQPAQTLTSRIGREMAEASIGSLHWAALLFCGLLLAVIAMGLSLLTQRKGVTA